MHDVLRFWLDRGVDGFRADVVHLIGKDPALADIPEANIVGSHLDVVGTHDYQGTHALLRGIRAVLDEYPGDRMMVGEVNLTKTELIAPYLGDGDELHLAFDFESLTVPWEAGAWRTRIAQVEDVMGARWPTWVLLQSRPAAHAHAPGRLGGPRARRRCSCCSRCAARRSSTPARSSASRTRTCPPERVVDPGRARRLPRADPVDRRPRPRLAGRAVAAVAARAGRRSVEAQRADEGSILHLARAILALRRASPALQRGTLTLLDDAPDGVLAYERADGDDRRRVWVNFGGETVALPAGWVVEMATADAGDGLPPDAAAVLRPASSRHSRANCITEGKGDGVAQGACRRPRARASFRHDSCVFRNTSQSDAGGGRIAHYRSIRRPLRLDRRYSIPR